LIDADRPVRIRVMIVDDQPMVRSGLSAFLSVADDFELVGEAENGTQALRMCADAQPDVVLMDLMMPGMDGVAATRAIVERFPDIRVIALTSFPQDRLVNEVLTAAPSSRLNLMLTDGSRLWATTVTHALWTRHVESGVLIASEPFDDDPAWQPVPDGSLVVAEPGDEGVVAAGSDGLPETAAVGTGLGFPPATSGPGLAGDSAPAVRATVARIRLRSPKATTRRARWAEVTTTDGLLPTGDTESCGDGSMVAPGPPTSFSRAQRPTDSLVTTGLAWLSRATSRPARRSALGPIR